MFFVTMSERFVLVRCVRVMEMYPCLRKRVASWDCLLLEYLERLAAAYWGTYGDNKIDIVSDE